MVFLSKKPFESYPYIGTKSIEVSDIAVRDKNNIEGVFFSRDIASNGAFTKYLARINQFRFL